MAVTQTRGEWVVGLNPDDRMPHDWLRMVARVFAAFRKKPLKDSIVVYIDGLNLFAYDIQGYLYTIKITSGQAFVDDQFVGFIEDSFLTFDTSYLIPETTYCVVLQYRWLNQFPPPEPRFNLVREIHVNSEEMLCLGKVICHVDNDGNCNIEIIDEKIPWYKEFVVATVGNAEVDTEDKLPYLVAIKSKGDSEYPDDPAHPENEIGTLDIGWAVDFHHYVGNNVNYNVRLHTDRSIDGALYINGAKILSNLIPGDARNPQDPVDSGDAYIDIANNVIINDYYNGSTPTANPDSDSGKACYGLHVTRLNDQNIGSDVSVGGNLCLDYNGVLSLSNRSDFANAASVINNVEITTTQDVVTINGHPIWHKGNLVSTGETIMFLGYKNSHPAARPDGSSVEIGDVYFNTAVSDFFFFKAPGEWRKIGIAHTHREYMFVAVDGQDTITWEYDPNFLIVSVSGTILPETEYTAIDGQTIIFNKTLEANDVVMLYTVVEDNRSIGALASSDYETAMDDVLSGSAGTFAPVEQKFQSMERVPPGAIMDYAGEEIPTGYLLCDGRSVRQDDYSRLYRTIGDKFGGTKTKFNLPNLCSTDDLIKKIIKI